MSRILILVLMSVPMMGQRFELHQFGQRQNLGMFERPQDSRVRAQYNNVAYTVTREGTGKTLTIIATLCTESEKDIQNFECVNLNKSAALEIAIVQALVDAFRAEWYGPENPEKKVEAGLGAIEARAPELVALDAKSNDRMVTVNLSTFAAKYSADLRGGVRGFGRRPFTNEAWVEHALPGGISLSIVNLDSGAVVGQIATTVTAQPSGQLVFSNSGNTLFEVARFEQGNVFTGVLLVYDTATRTVKRTLPLPFPPTATLMSPDGSTLYFFDGSNKILYYDLLSGTADLTVTLPFADSLLSPYRMHPNGKIYGANGGRVFVYDPQTRKVISKFNLGFTAVNSFITNMQFSPDGLRLHVLDNTSQRTPGAQGNVYLLDAVTGYNFGSQPIGGMEGLFFVAPALQ